MRSTIEAMPAVFSKRHEVLYYPASVCAALSVVTGAASLLTLFSVKY